LKFIAIVSLPSFMVESARTIIPQSDSIENYDRNVSLERQDVNTQTVPLTFLPQSDTKSPYSDEKGGP